MRCGNTGMVLPIVLCGNSWEWTLACFSDRIPGGEKTQLCGAVTLCGVWGHQAGRRHFLPPNFSRLYLMWKVSITKKKTAWCSISCCYFFFLANQMKLQTCWVTIPSKVESVIWEWLTSELKTICESEKQEERFYFCCQNRDQLVAQYLIFLSSLTTCAEVDNTVGKTRTDRATDGRKKCDGRLEFAGQGCQNSSNFQAWNSDLSRGLLMTQSALNTKHPNI